MLGPAVSFLYPKKLATIAIKRRGEVILKRHINDDNNCINYLILSDLYLVILTSNMQTIQERSSSNWLESVPHFYKIAGLTEVLMEEPTKNNIKFQT